MTEVQGGIVGAGYLTFCIVLLALVKSLSDVVSGIIHGSHVSRLHQGHRRASDKKKAGKA